jgi:hypothetical protein
MASSFSVWLHETARLYLRYAAVGLIGIPLALLYGLARRADWNTTVVAGALIVLGFVSAFLLWRRLGDWEVTTATIPTGETNDAWADLVKTAIHTAIPHQQVILTQQLAALDVTAWRHTLASEEFEAFDAAVRRSLLAQQLTTLEEEQRRLRREVPRQQLSRPTESPEQIGQRQPAWALALNGQPQNAYGLA